METIKKYGLGVIACFLMFFIYACNDSGNGSSSTAKNPAETAPVQALKISILKSDRASETALAGNPAARTQTSMVLSADEKFVLRQYDKNDLEVPCREGINCVDGAIRLDNRDMDTDAVMFVIFDGVTAKVSGEITGINETGDEEIHYFGMSEEIINSGNKTIEIGLILFPVAETETIPQIQKNFSVTINTSALLGSYLSKMDRAIATLSCANNAALHESFEMTFDAANNQLSSGNKTMLLVPGTACEFRVQVYVDNQPIIQGTVGIVIDGAAYQQIDGMIFQRVSAVVSTGLWVEDTGTWTVSLSDLAHDHLVQDARELSGKSSGVVTVVMNYNQASQEFLYQEGKWIAAIKNVNFSDTTAVIEFAVNVDSLTVLKTDAVSPAKLGHHENVLVFNFNRDLHITAQINGTLFLQVLDARSRAPLEGYKVTISSLDRPENSFTRTTSLFGYVLESLVPGKYAVSLDGMKKVLIATIRENGIFDKQIYVSEHEDD
ncbi:MAG: carboxypeptidase regulatory-like domain-containing protein [SAR324 cluster bacterium]|nr:carboxypeptidase regulatory-like domain-containing protein [SAR324 cluster bacterium]